MPSAQKMLPKSRKCVTDTARARISVTKARKVKHLGNKETVSNLPPVTQPSTSSDNSDAIMTMLSEIRDSNAVLARHPAKVERHN